MSSDRSRLEQLRRYIGRVVIHKGIRCQVIEVLEDAPALVLLDVEQHTHIQDNQYGEPQRRVPRTYTVPLLDTGETLHPEFVRLGLVSTE